MKSIVNIIRVGNVHSVSLGKGNSVCTSNSILEPNSKSNYSEHFLHIQFPIDFRVG